jgi:quinol-cytochrome oxidoreductase complex cytochrome b subunit
MRRKDLLGRIGWTEHLRPFLYKELPPKCGWAATLGSLCTLLFAIMGVTGLFLAMYYNPSPSEAYQSVDFIMKSVPAGGLLRGIHHWGAGAMVLAVFIHMMANFFTGTFKAPREATWTFGVLLLLVTLGLGFAGYLLPWDMKAYWATVVSTNIPTDIPWIGNFISRTMRGGDTVSGLTLTRFYAIHMVLLPALLAVFTMIHIYLVRLHGLTEPAGRKQQTPEPAQPECEYRFYPEHMLRSSLVFVAVFVGIVALAAIRGVPREPIAGTISDSYLPRPEWYFMWLFQLLTYFPGKWEWVGSLVIPALGIALLFALPFLERSEVNGVAGRPMAVAGGVTFLVAIFFLTVQGFEGTLPYGQVVPVPDRQLTAVEQRGVAVFFDHDCAYCHQIGGKGGHRVGPDLANVVARHRTEDYLVRYIRDPQSISKTSVMPKYDLPDADLHALAQFLLSLDFSKYPQRMVPREAALKAAVAAPDASRRPSTSH